MFTGLIEDVGLVVNRRKKGNGLVLDIKSEIICSDIGKGDSVNINGVCQTVTGFERDSFEVEAIRETLERSNLGLLLPNDRVNLERSLNLTARLGGHLVYGHIDCLGEITGISPMGEQVDIAVKYAEGFSRYIVMKGSIAMEGISLTVAENSPGLFKVSIIPHSLEATNLVYKKIGDRVNLEFDIMAKYVENMLNSNPSSGSITIDKLKEKGW